MGAEGVGAAQYRTVLGHFATGVTIVTASTPDGPVGFTCQSFSALSLDPPLVLIAPAATSTTWPAIAAVGAFTVNVLASGAEALARQFATSGTEKFAGVGFTLGATGAPRLDGALAVVDCTVASALPTGDHHVVVGAVVAVASTDGLPLLYYRGGFGQFAP